MSALAQIATRWRAGARPQGTTGPVGIDLALEQVHLIQFTRDNPDAAVSCRARTSVHYPVSRATAISTAGALAPLLRAAMREAPFVGRRAVVALPGGAFRTLSISYQVQRGQSDAAVLAALLRERIEGDLADYVVDFVPVRKRAGETERLALVATAPKQDVLRFLEEFRRARIEVERLEIGPLALRRLVNALPDTERDECVIVVNTGQSDTYLTVLAGRRLLADQSFRFGETELLAQVATALDMTADGAAKLIARTGLAPLRSTDQVSTALNESGVFNTLLEIVKPELMRLVLEIERAMLFAASETHGNKLSRVYLVGALSRWRGIARALGTVLGLEVRNLSAPLSFFEPAGQHHEDSADMVVAAGLALRGVVDDD